MEQTNPLSAAERLAVAVGEPTPEQIAAQVITAAIDKASRTNPLLNPNVSVVSDENLNRLDYVYQLLTTLDPGDIRDQLLFCYHIIQAALVENAELKRKLLEVVQAYALLSLKSGNQGFNFRTHF